MPNGVINRNGKAERGAPPTNRDLTPPESDPTKQAFDWSERKKSKHKKDKIKKFK